MNMKTICPGCGLELEACGAALDPMMNASAECRQLYYDVSFYTLGKRDPFFLHQVLVDADGAQHYKMGAPRIGLAFALIGLCLVLEHDYSGKDVQNAHIRLAAKRKDWPQFEPSTQKTPLTIADVLAAPPGDERDAVMMQWAAAVWDTYTHEQQHVREMLREMQEVDPG